MIENLCRMGATVGVGLGTFFTSLLVGSTAGISTGSAEQLFASIIGGGAGAAIAWVCIRHIIDRSKAQDEEIKRLNKIIYDITTKDKS